ncbi:MAG: arsenate reductase ArsC [Deltaproteobacteria bacterium]
MRDGPFNVLFLCTHNSARSVIAECVMNELGKERFKAFSAGSQPSGRVNPHAIEMLEQLNYDVSGLRSKSWNEFAAPDAPKMDFVFTVCDDAANETCPYWPGQPMTAHWGLPDPSRMLGSEAEVRAAFADTHRMLYQRISIFLNLPLSTLDKMSLQSKLDEIGRMPRAAERAEPEA